MHKAHKSSAQRIISGRPRGGILSLLLPGVLFLGILRPAHAGPYPYPGTRMIRIIAAAPSLDAKTYFLAAASAATSAVRTPKAVTVAEEIM